MFGRVRSAPCSAESLERPTSKIIKDDSLSIYEATLVKLQVGAQRDLSSHSDMAMEILTDCTDKSVSECSQPPTNSLQESMTIDSDSPFENASSNSSCGESVISLQPQRSKNLSIVQMFSTYGKSQNIRTPLCDEAMALENGSFPCSSTGSSNCQSARKEQQPDSACFSS